MSQGRPRLTPGAPLLCPAIPLASQCRAWQNA